jgi:hypothetical protein
MSEQRGRIRIAVPEDRNPDGTIARWTAEADLVPGTPYTYSTIGVSVYVDWGDGIERRDYSYPPLKEAIDAAFSDFRRAAAASPTPDTPEVE